MRVLRVIARTCLKILISPDTQQIEIEQDATIKDEKMVFYKLLPVTLLGEIIRTDDVQAIRPLFRARLISDEIQGKHWSYKTLLDIVVKFDAVQIFAELLLKQGWQADEDTCSDATFHGSIAVLKYIVNNDKPIAENLCTVAAGASQLKTLKWLRSQNHTWDEKTTLEVAERGAIPILEWLWQQACPWPEKGEALKASLENGEWAAFKWQLENDCKIPKDLCYEIHTVLSDIIIDIDTQKEIYDIVEDAGRCTCDGEYHPADLQDDDGRELEFLGNYI